MLSDCWSGLGAGSSSTGTMVPQSSSGLEPAGAAPAVAAAGTSAARSSNPARILRKLRTASGTAAMRTESAEEASSASVEMLAMSSTGSVRSRGSRYSLETGAAAGGNNNNYKVSYFVQIDSFRVENINTKKDTITSEWKNVSIGRIHYSHPSLQEFAHEKLTKEHYTGVQSRRKLLNIADRIQYSSQINSTNYDFYFEQNMSA